MAPGTSLSIAEGPDPALLLALILPSLVGGSLAAMQSLTHSKGPCVSQGWRQLCLSQRPARTAGVPQERCRHGLHFIEIEPLLRSLSSKILREIILFC